MGIEPTNNGFANRPPEIIKNCKRNTYENQQKNWAEILAFLSQKDPDLAMVVKRWPDLPEHIKATIKTLIETAGK